ncbi:MAG: hypothetical protein IPL50_03830 [Chitinophagaceae bacterium]|nr:hypothetical protein [Chitinophagaceae bacterium]
MRIIFIYVLFFSVKLSAQIPVDDCKQVTDIALAEQLAHQRIVEGTYNILGNTSASNNFDVTYYRCEWEVNPAVRYISGKVTVYFFITTGTGNIQLDLMNPLIVDSVKQRNEVLVKQHTSNTLTVNFSSPINAGVLDSISIFYRGFRPIPALGHLSRISTWAFLLCGA